MLKINDVALCVDVSEKTIINWYRWKASHPGHKLSELLPDYLTDVKTGVRYWRAADIILLTKFKALTKS